jgi:ABC-type branched-subunit amino acid transport system ATPase component/ABC-type branched-subunit amino acid transport system permease subunit
VTHLGFLLLGAGNGAVFAAIALALVVTYRSSGVVNFASGVIGLYAAYTYAFLRRGELLLPVPGVPPTWTFADSLPFWPAFLIALAVVALLGALLYGLVFRPLRSAPAVSKVVASIGVMVLIQSVLAVRVGNRPVRVTAILPSATLKVGDIAVKTDRLWFAGAVILVAAGLAVVLAYTRFGLSSRATAESEKGALVTGLSPDRIATVSWMVGGAVAGFGGILISPIVPLSPVSYTLFIVPALACALVGNFTSIGPAVGAGLAIGMVQSELAYLQTEYSWFPQHGLAELVPLVIVLVVLVVRGKPLPSRGAVVLQTLGRAPRSRFLLVPTLVGVAVAVVVLSLTHGSYRAAAVTSIIFAVVALSYVIVTGYAGQVSLAQLTLAGAGAFMVARLSYNVGVPFPLGAILAALAATAIGVVIGLPALRVRGLPVAVVTLALAVVLVAVWFQNPDLVGDAQAAAKVKPPSLLGIDLGPGTGKAYPRIGFALLCLAVLTVTALGVAWLRRHRLGAAMLAVRANERSAAASGINVARTKLVAFGLGSFIAGLGGALLAYQYTVATAQHFDPVVGLGFFTTVYIAGITSVLGGILAGVFVAGGFLYLAITRTVDVGGWYYALTGIGLIVTVIRHPEGIAGSVHRLADRIRRSLPAPSGPAAPVIAERPAPARNGERRTGRAILELRDIGVRYGGVTALDRVTLSVAEGSITGLIGPNGAGKTTLIDVISGFTDSSGTVVLDGRTVDGLKPHERARIGLGRTFQGIDLYEDLSVEENILVGEEAARRRGAGGGDASLDHLLALLHLDHVRELPVRALSQGQRQLVSVARALAGRPRLLLLDEPAAGLDSSESRWLGERLREVGDAGVTILMIDHDMGFLLGVCEHVHVLDLGVLIASGSPAKIQGDPLVAAAYLGTAPDAVHDAVGAERTVGADT